MSPDDHSYAPGARGKSADSGVTIVPSVCPHDCTSTCALDVERLNSKQIGRVRGSMRNDYTAGVICEKVARYAERIHHPDRLMKPLRRVGPKGSRQFAEISWADALDIVAEQFMAKARQHGSETVWPYYYAGTMGLVQRDGINRLRHAMKYSRYFSTICVTLSDTGWIAGVGAKRGADVREVDEHSELVVIWGGNPVNTQVNVMTHAMRAKKRGAKLVVVDPYRTGTAEQADIHLAVRPGTDGALAVAVMHVLFKEGYADWDYMRRYTDAPDELAAHVATRTPEWASKITGLSVEEIVSFARLYGQTKASFIRCHHGFSRSRNGAHNMHAVTSLPAVTGAWKYKGGGALYGHTGMYPIKKTLIEGLDVVDTSIRELDQSRLGPILTGDREALKNGPPVTALLIQNTNPAMVCPELELVHKGFAREDLFTCVHEQFLTETAAFADIVLPATMFLEHDDFYTASGHTFFQVTKAVIEPPGECRENHYVIAELAKRLGAQASRLRHDAVGDHGRVAQGLGHVGRRDQLEEGRPGFPPGLRDLALPRRLRLARQEVPLQARLGGLWSARQGHADAARPFRRDRQCHGRQAVPHGRGAGAHLPQLDFHRDAEQPEARGAADGDDESRRLRGAGLRRGRAARDRQRARQDHRALQAQGRPAEGRRDRRRHLAQPQLRDRHGHQRADLGRSRLAARRRGVPRHRRLDPQTGVSSQANSPPHAVGRWRAAPEGSWASSRCS